MRYPRYAPARDKRATGRVPIRVALMSRRIAITTSVNLAHRGRIGLHAAPAGGGTLLGFHGNHCGLLQLPAAAVLPVRRANDGRLFYTDEARAGQLAVNYQQWR